MNLFPTRQTVTYAGLVAVCLLAALLVGWTPIATQIDHYHYDWMFRLYPVESGPLNCRLLAIDEETLQITGGRRFLRPKLAAALEIVAAARPKAVAVDLILSDQAGPEEDAQLEAALERVPNLLLAADLIPYSGRWEDPLPGFRKAAVGVGHVHADPDKYDGVSRQILLEKVGGRDRRWALALEAFRLFRGARHITESPEDLDLDGLRVPAPVTHEGRPLLIRYRAGPIPRTGLRRLLEQPELARDFAGRVVFVGVTAQTEARDRLVTPYSNSQIMPGVEIHGHAFETLAQGQFLLPASGTAAVLFCLLLAALAGLVFHFRGGWLAYGAGALIIAAGHAAPHLLFQRGVVFPFLAPAAAAWLSVIGCAGYQYFATRRALRKSEEGRKHYQQAIHFVTHEMRTPLATIQGSSEIMGRYNLTEEKRKQMVEMINSESRRLGRMIQTFLDVERLGAGHMEMKKEPFALQDLVSATLERVRPLAERKRIGLELGAATGARVLGDRELMEYAVYNLLTNAVKYSPSGTVVRVDGVSDAGQVRLSVRDQGIGMDEKELKNLFQKFYRTKRAEASGEKGTGIGLSLVREIVTHHGGRIEVTSAPRKGSCFTVVLPLTPGGTGN